MRQFSGQGEFAAKAVESPVAARRNTPDDLQGDDLVCEGVGGFIDDAGGATPENLEYGVAFSQCVPGI